MHLQETRYVINEYIIEVTSNFKYTVKNYELKCQLQPT